MKKGRGIGMNYVNNDGLRRLRESRGLTQKDLAEQLGVSDKTVSKWETGRGLPDISLLSPLAEALGVSLSELFTGARTINRNKSGNMQRSVFYVCPVCGNVIHAMGEGSFSCCGVELPRLDAETCDAEHEISVDIVDDEYYVHLKHPMSKDHYISFMAFVNWERLQLVKLYPEQEAAARFQRCGRGTLYVCCQKHGLYSTRV